MLHYTFIQHAIYVSFIIAILCPSIGIFLVVRRYSMIGDTLAHSSLAGVSLGLLLDKNPILGAFIFTSLCGALIEFLRRYFKKYTDLILAIVLSLSVGIAISIISSGKLTSNAESYLFGSILTVSDTDMITISVLGIITIILIIFLYNQLIYISYDEEAARVAGVRVQVINFVFSILVAATIAASVRIVGVLVLSSMIAIPVATAIQLDMGFKKTLFASIIISIIDIMTGLVSSYYINVAPGGFTAVVSVIVLMIVITGKIIYKKLFFGKKGIADAGKTA